jgi:hypothetical protein
LLYTNKLKHKTMENLLLEAKLRDLANDLKIQGMKQSKIDRLICELRQNPFSLGLNRLIGFIIIGNN